MSVKIKDTTREEREAIVDRAYAIAGVDGYGSTPKEVWNDYIEGKRELDDIYNDINKGDI